MKKTVKNEKLTTGEHYMKSTKIIITSALGALAVAGAAHAATVTDWDTTNVVMYDGPLEMYNSYINTFIF